ncbi:MAG: LCP family protein [Propionibacteriaceae bacterium]|nr:LCP family protein [Propionibacteriaceae bacterium]
MSNNPQPRHSTTGRSTPVERATFTPRGRVVVTVVAVLVVLGLTTGIASATGSSLAWLFGIPMTVVAALVGILGRSAVFTVASTILPGLGLLGARSRIAKVLGVVLPVAMLGFIAWQGLSASTDFGDFAGFVVNPSELRTFTVVMVAVGLLWVTMIAGTHLLTRPKGWSWGRRALGAILVAALSFGVAGSAALAARYAYDTKKLVNTVFPSQDEVKSTSRPSIDAKEKDPWKNTPRLNILLVGADSANARDKAFSLRADTLMVASIDTTTGATTLVQIPRNVQYTPFPEGSEMAEEFPRGFRGEGDPAQWFINAMWEKTELEYPHLFEGQTYRGAEALKQGVQGITGLKIDYFMLLNIDGVQRLIDAMGGVTVNINRRLPVAGNTTGKRPTSWLEPGPDQRLGGYDAMWYARSRSDSSDYERMGRQSCLVNAIIKQANPATMLSSYEAIAAASADMVMTDIPQQVLEPMVSLSLKVKDADITRLVFSPGKNGYDFARPDFEAMNQAVQDAIAPVTASVTPLPTATSTPDATPTTESPATTSPSPEPSVSPTATLVEGAQGVEDACAYNPSDE